MTMTFTRRFFAAALCGLALTLATASAPARAAGVEDTAKAFVESLAQQAIDSLTVQGIDRPERIARFRTLFNDAFAVKGIGKWILGRYWKKASEAEQTEYLKLFEDLMVVSYVDRFAKYTGEKLAITKTLKQNDTNATVFSEIQAEAGGKNVRVDWKVQTKADKTKIVDVMVEGTSMSQTLRSDFGSIIKQRGGTVAGLLEALREKTESLKSEG